jgi:hypothetical protein
MIDLSIQYHQLVTSRSRCLTVTAALAPLLGFQAGHTNSIAGMLGRVEGGAHDVRLSVELALQTATQGALDCISMRRGLWDGGGLGSRRRACCPSVLRLPVAPPPAPGLTSAPANGPAARLQRGPPP